MNIFEDMNGDGRSGRSEGKFIFFIRRLSKYYVSISHQQRSGGRRPGEAIPRRDASPHREGGLVAIMAARGRVPIL